MGARRSHNSARRRLLRVRDADWHRLLHCRAMLRMLGHGGRISGPEVIAVMIEVAHRELARRCRKRGLDPDAAHVPTSLLVHVPADPVAFARGESARKTRVERPRPPRRVAFNKQRARADARDVRAIAVDQAWRELPPA